MCFLVVLGCWLFLGCCRFLIRLMWWTSIFDLVGVGVVFWGGIGIIWWKGCYGELLLFFFVGVRRLFG